MTWSAESISHPKDKTTSTTPTLQVDNQTIANRTLLLSAEVPTKIIIPTIILPTSNKGQAISKTEIRITIISQEVSIIIIDLQLILELASFVNKLNTLLTTASRAIQDLSTIMLDLAPIIKMLFNFWLKL